MGSPSSSASASCRSRSEELNCLNSLEAKYPERLIQRLSQLRGQGRIQCDLDAAEVSVQRSLVL